MKENRLKAFEFLRELIKIDTVQGDPLPGAPFGEGNRRALEVVLRAMSDGGYRVCNLEGYAGYAERGEGKLFGVLGHLDVVPADGNWTHPPFSGTLDADGVLYGRGTLDDKGPMIAAAAAADELFAEGEKLRCRLRFIFGCNEESGWQCMERYLKTEELPEEGFSPDGDFPVIYAEKGVAYHTLTVKKPAVILDFTAGSRPNIVPDEATAVVLYRDGMEERAKAFGIEVLRRVEEDPAADRKGGTVTLTARGKAAHGSHPEAGENAAVKLLSFLSAYDDDACELYRKLSKSDGEYLGLKRRDEKSGALTMNVGVVRTEDTTMNVTLDIRHPNSMERETVTEILSSDDTFAVSAGAYHDPLYVDPTDPLVVSLNEAFCEVTGRTDKPIAIGGATYARVLPKGVAFGPIFPGAESCIHQPDERISMPEFDTLVDIYKAALKKLCF